MRFLIQRVTKASCEVEGTVTGSIGKGFLVFIGIADSDTEETADRMIRKMSHLRIFDDSEGRTNLSLEDTKGDLLLISQFTLYADCRKGNRPSFFRAGEPKHAEALYEYILRKCAGLIPGGRTGHGIFGAVMEISLVNDGPFTILLDSEELGMH